MYCRFRPFLLKKKLKMSHFLIIWFPALQSEYKFPDRNITIFPNLWYKSGSVLQKRRHDILKTKKITVQMITRSSTRNRQEIGMKNLRKNVWTPSRDAVQI